MHMDPLMPALVGIVFVILVLAVLLVQDVAIIPMLMAIGYFAGDSPSTTTLITQLLAGAGIIGLLGFVATKEHTPLPIGKWLGDDKELQVLGAFAVAFGLAFLTGIAGLSAALGAFVGGVVVGASRETEWIHESLYSFHVFLLAAFFVSIAMIALSLLVTQSGPTPYAAGETHPPRKRRNTTAI